jgi:hypothetical protein
MLLYNGFASETTFTVPVANSFKNVGTVKYLNPDAHGDPAWVTLIKSEISRKNHKGK